jgi:2-polyprenyl-3-methyl-5-hydroxy-6-metoxy-1,4-benzoquinol methylase
MKPNVGMLALSLRYSVEWRPYLWLRPLEYALGDPMRFDGKRILDLGCRYGKMACWFAAQGAIVDGVDVSREAIALAKVEQSKWRIGDHVLSFRVFDGNLAKLPLGEYDFVFTKSVLTILGDPDRSNWA